MLATLWRTTPRVCVLEAENSSNCSILQDECWLSQSTPIVTSPRFLVLPATALLFELLTLNNYRLNWK